MSIYRLDLAYDGTGFHGLARQPGLDTIQGKVEGALATVLGYSVVTTAAGRTDAGVHARQQVFSFECHDRIAPDRLLRSIAGILAPEIVPWSLVPAPAGFNARFSAKSRTYHYQILNAPSPDPLRRLQVWHISEPLEVGAMDLSVRYLIGEHDFASFCRGPGPTIRRLMTADWTKDTDLLVMTATANAFCHQMIRSIVGLSCEVGKGHRQPEQVLEVLAAQDRALAGQIAPPRGLVLWAVDYQA
jgi:tRNA pseudouridine38-40 synthase